MSLSEDQWSKCRLFCHPNNPVKNEIAILYHDCNNKLQKTGIVEAEKNENLPLNFDENKYNPFDSRNDYDACDGNETTNESRSTQTETFVSSQNTINLSDGECYSFNCTNQTTDPNSIIISNIANAQSL